MWKQFTVQGDALYLDILLKIPEKYNNTKNSPIKMTPVEASKKKNEGIFYCNLYGGARVPYARVAGPSDPYRPKFKIGDSDRVSKYKRKTFDKGYTPNWAEEIFKVDIIQSTNPVTYRLKDLNNDPIQDSFTSLVQPPIWQEGQHQPRTQIPQLN